MLALFLVAATGGAEVATAQGAKCQFVRIVDWPVRLVRNHVVVDGAINGKKIGITLDTGAQVSLILRSAAARLDLPRREAPGQRMFGVGGESKIEIADVDDFKLGEVSTKGMQLFVAGEREFGDGVDVLLGEDFLRKFDVEFDIAHRAVRLYEPRNCDGVSLAYWTKDTPGEVGIGRIDDAHPRISLTVQLNGKPVEAILDSGASTTVLTRQDAASVGITPDSPGVVAGYSSQGLGARTLDSWSGPFQSFAIGNESIPDVRIRFADLYKDTTYTATGSRITRNVSQTQPMLLGADFLRAHRTLVAHSRASSISPMSEGRCSWPIRRPRSRRLAPAPRRRPLQGPSKVLRADDRHAMRNRLSLGHLDVQQRRILLRAEDIGIAGTAAGAQPVDRELDRVARIELHEIGDALRRKTVELLHRFARQHPRALDALVCRAIGKDDVERDQVDTGILAADRLGQRRKLLRLHRGRHHVPAVVMCVGNSSSGLSQRSV